MQGMYFFTYVLSGSCVRNTQRLGMKRGRDQQGGGFGYTIGDASMNEGHQRTERSTSCPGALIYVQLRTTKTESMYLPNKELNVFYLS